MSNAGWGGSRRGVIVSLTAVYRCVARLWVGAIVRGRGWALYVEVLFGASIKTATTVG